MGIVERRSMDVLLALAVTDPTYKLNSWRIEDELGISGKKVRQCINYLRQEGEPICSDKEGYWLGPQDEIGLYKTIIGLESRIKGIKLAIAGLRRTVKHMEKETK